MIGQVIVMASGNFCFEPMHDHAPRKRLNYRRCGLCKNHFLVDSSGSNYCGQELCIAVRMAIQKEIESKEFAGRLPVA